VIKVLSTSLGKVGRSLEKIGSWKIEVGRSLGIVGSWKKLRESRKLEDADSWKLEETWGKLEVGRSKLAVGEVSCDS
jgi:hypothetical protein